MFDHVIDNHEGNFEDTVGRTIKLIERV
jgi:hypothetical protein